MHYSDVVEPRKYITLKHTHILCSGDKKLAIRCIVYFFPEGLYKCVSVHKTSCGGILLLVLFYLFGFYVAFNTVQVISRRVVGKAEETSTYSSLGFSTVNCRPTASNYHISHLRLCREPNPGLRGGILLVILFLSPLNMLCRKCSLDSKIIKNSLKLISFCNFKLCLSSIYL